MVAFINSKDKAAEAPAEAKEVYSGVIFSAHQWDVKLKNGELAKFEKLSRMPTVNVFATVGDKILVTNETQPAKPPFRSIPGGRVEPGEDPIDVAARELLEETGYQGGSPDLCIVGAPHSKIDWAVYTFVIRDCKKVAEQNLDPGEEISFELLDWDQLVESLIFDTEFRQVSLSLLFAKAKLRGELDKLRDFIFSGKRDPLSFGM